MSDFLSNQILKFRQPKQLTVKFLPKKERIFKNDLIDHKKKSTYVIYTKDPKFELN